MPRTGGSDCGLWGDDPVEASPLSLRFIDSSSGVVSWYRNFGNGMTTAEHELLHTCARPGWYLVSRMVTRSDGTTSTVNRYGSVVATGPVPVPSPVASADCTANVTGGLAPRAPVAHFNLSRESGPAPLYVRFTDGSENAASWLWNFGGFAWTTAQNPSVVFRRPGIHEVSLTVKNPWGTPVTTPNVTVSGELTGRTGEPPVAVVGRPEPPDVAGGVICNGFTPPPTLLAMVDRRPCLPAPFQPYGKHRYPINLDLYDCCLLPRFVTPPLPIDRTALSPSVVHGPRLLTSPRSMVRPHLAPDEVESRDKSRNRPMLSCHGWDADDGSSVPCAGQTFQGWAIVPRASRRGRC